MQSYPYSPKPLISLGKRLRSCPSCRCLGVAVNWADYSEESQAAIRGADKVYYPSRIYEDLFEAVGKEVFPRNYYRLMGDKILQTSLFQLLNIPHPRTRIFYGKNRLERLLDEFSYPFVAKAPVGSSQGEGVWLIANQDQLEWYLENHYPAYIQEYLPIDRDLRVVVIAARVVHAYWRVGAAGEFRNNVSRGAAISFAGVPGEALDFALEVADKCRFDEVGLDICEIDGRYCVIEANMVYGMQGFRQSRLDIYDIFRRLDEEGVL